MSSMIEDPVPVKEDDDSPQAFLYCANLNNVLEQATTKNIKSAILMLMDGSLLSVAGDVHIEKIIGALVANIWKENSASAQKAFGAGEPSLMLISCEDGKLAVTRISRFLLCLYADKSVEIGILKSKLATLSSYLDKPLRQVWKEKPISTDNSTDSKESRQ
eukprot:TRINITY_DN6389_c0_g1_i1.p1 TRINITY_DN6389_c0_g1~~TRINITY_DN6389_c0_g1_i1.p1  ORF type:complete len:161 (+),score=31.24 TRINITY_DN6389_c0_g1_i1:139-621(+)